MAATSVLTFREKERDRKRIYRGKNPAPEKPFVGIDGEGGNDEADHCYVFLRAGNRTLTTGFKRLLTQQCLAWIANLPPDVIYVGYYFDYDVTKILQDISYTKAWRLLHRESRMPTKVKRSQPFPVTIEGYEVDYLPGKEFKVRNPVTKRWVIINDVGSFFQCSFVSAIDTWRIGTARERELIAEGKAKRSAFTLAQFGDSITRKEIDDYNRLEIKLLVQLMNRFRETCKRAGYVPRKWQGPGQIAEAMMSARGVPRSSDTPLLVSQHPVARELLEVAQNAYYGGRPEITRHGPIGPAIQYDINSAYPRALLEVPCLIHGKWRRITDHGSHGKDEYAICFGHFYDPNKSKTQDMPRLYGLPIRSDKGTIGYPAEGNGWYWAFEIHAASHQTFECQYSFTYEKRCNCVPFDFIRQVYELRLRLGKDALGLVLKLALNSLYGKTCQSIGNPKYANPIWASFITAYVRTRVQELIHLSPGHKRGRCGYEIAMIATDAVFSLVPLPVTESKELGGISIESHPQGMFLIQPGLYFGSAVDKDGVPKRAKTRGVPTNVVAEHEQEFRDAFTRMNRTKKLQEGTVRLPVTTFIGIRQAVHRHRMDLLGQWVEYGKETDPERPGKDISFDWTSKRTGGFSSHPMSSPGYGLVTLPYWGRPDLTTTPYDKDIGALLEDAKIDFDNQPDWAPVMMPVPEGV